MNEPANLPIKDGEGRPPRSPDKVLADAVVTRIAQEFISHAARGPHVLLKLPGVDGPDSHMKVEDLVYSLLKESPDLCNKAFGVLMIGVAVGQPGGPTIENVRNASRMALTSIAQAYAQVMVAMLKDQQLAAPRQ